MSRRTTQFAKSLHSAMRFTAPKNGSVRVLTAARSAKEAAQFLIPPGMRTEKAARLLNRFGKER